MISLTLQCNIAQEIQEIEVEINQSWFDQILNKNKIIIILYNPIF